MPAWARPVRILARLVLSASRLFAMRSSADFLTSDVLISFPLSNVHQGAFVFTKHHAPQCARLVDGKHLDRQLLVAAQRKGRGVHDFETAHDYFVKADTGVAGC